MLFDDGMVVSRNKYHQLKKEWDTLKDLVDEIAFISRGRNNTFRDDPHYQLVGIRELVNKAIVKDNDN